MATKAEYQTLINTKLADSSDIIAEELREVEFATGDELYVTQTVDTGAFPINVIEGLVTNVSFRIDIAKRGNNCTINGWIFNGTGAIISNLEVLEITDALYFVNPDATYDISPRTTGSIEGTTSALTVVLSQSTNKIYFLGSLGVSKRLNFSLTYTTLE
jgi:hypothetical protein